VTVEDALIALLAAVAGILLFLGLAQALDSRPPRLLRRRDRSLPELPEWRGARRRMSPVPGDAAQDPAGEPVATTPIGAGATGLTAAPPAPPGTPEAPPEAPAAPPAAMAAPFPPTPAPVDGAATPAVSPSPDAGPRLVETCAALYMTGKHADLLESAARWVGEDDASDSTTATVTAPLCSLIALSRHALGDAAGSREAFAAALAALPRAVEAGPPAWLAPMAGSIARRLIETAEQSPEGTEERIIAPRLAALWLGGWLAAEPEDGAAQQALEAARAALCEGYRDAFAGSLRDQDWSTARRLLDEVSDASVLPASRGEALLEVLAARLRKEIEGLTGAAIDGAGDEGSAVAALEQAKAALATVTARNFPARPRAAMTGRVWRGYAQLGRRRLKSGDLDGAATVLIEALDTKRIGHRRQRQIREAVVWALEAMGERKVEAIATLLDAGDRAGAAAEVERLRAHIRRAQESGITAEALSVASTRAGRLARGLGGSPGE